MNSGVYVPGTPRQRTRVRWAVAAGVMALGLLVAADALRGYVLAVMGHGHAGEHASAHGGVLQSVGGHHLEALLEQDGKLRVYVLGKDAQQLQPIPAERLAADVQAPGRPEYGSLTLLPLRLGGEPKGTAASFRGELPAAFRGGDLTAVVTVPLEGQLYRARFELTGTAAAHGAPAMPPAATSKEEAELYQQPGGLYTEADIAANERQVPSVKFKEFRAAHDMNPKSGDRLCPITATKANPACSWVVAGQNYEFCCPPCLDEFMRLAKKHPEKVHPPDWYRKK